jgi:hypothetical protein
VLEVLTTEAEAKILSGASGVMRAATLLFASDCPRMTIAPKPPTPAATWFAGLHTLTESSQSKNRISGPDSQRWVLSELVSSPGTRRQKAHSLCFAKLFSANSL